ncbi:MULTISPECIES: FkbM family methyltransferase [unclassified Ruminococcus]|uniref:FkbM family methyltransferase n=1 Tax=unclassified Ruminococcus TaxID=2608920 RepID=UPI00210C2FB4|nr:MULTISPECIES: FkbM family methyltransferase [unclassified Ruminococcus]MCQ4022656.1 FkbM family methyltransferase [Ruminococcus sp. zg-924]MCQ4114896.1 FkbM family methyltransferase [Ruminococcus sp. zg-921]
MTDLLKNEISSWEYISQSGLPVVIYGMGNGADVIINRLDKYGISVTDFFASDDFVRGQSFHGKRVKRLLEIEQELDDFIILIGFGTQRTDVIDNIKNIAKRHTVIAPTAPVFGNNFFDKNFVRQNSDKLQAAYELFKEEKSRRVYENIVRFNYTGRLEYLFAADSEKDEVFMNVLKLADDENYLDLGAYRGDTIDEFLRFCDGKYSSITAVEPDAKTFKKLMEHCSCLDRFEAFNAAAWSSNTEIFFDKKGGRMSAVSDNGAKVKSVSVDELYSSRDVSYIKADVEGCEYEMLLGAKTTIKQCKPKLNIALYHRGEDIFKLPLMLKELRPDYSFFLRHHPYIPSWDTNLYCI